MLDLLKRLLPGRGLPFMLGFFGCLLSVRGLPLTFDFLGAARKCSVIKQDEDHLPVTEDAIDYDYDYMRRS
jgi:hypothetical protein